MKKFLVVLLACAMIFGFATTAFAADTQIEKFNDIADQSVAAQNAVMKLAVLGVVEGNEGIGGAFRPGDNLTRAEFAKIVCYLTDNVKIAESLSSVSSKFTDVTTGNWYTGWVNAAAQSGYFMGDPGGTFRPNANITMQEVVTVALRCAGYTDKLGSSTGNTTWPANYITKAMNVGMLDDVTFVGSAAATRADMAVICNEVLGINMVVHIANDIAYALALTEGTVDPDGYSEIYYISNETNRNKVYETILHKAFKGQYYDVQVNPALVTGKLDKDAAKVTVDGKDYYKYEDYSFNGDYDESYGWNYEDYSSGELAINIQNSYIYDDDKKFEDRIGYYNNGNVWVDSTYNSAEALASTYYITRDFDLTELAGMQVQVIVIDNKEICFVDVVSSFVYGDSIHQDRKATSTSAAQNILIDGKSYRPSATMDVKNRVANIEDYSLGFGNPSTVGDYKVHSAIQYLNNSNEDDDFNGKVYLDKDGRIYAVKNYAAYDSTPFGIFEEIDSSRANWKFRSNSDVNIETNKPYTLYKDGQAIKAEDLDENDLVSYLDKNGAPFFLATAPQEGELTAHNKYNNKLTLGGTAYGLINPRSFQYSDDGGETFSTIDLADYEVDFGEAEFAKAYNFAKAGYVAGNLSNQKVIGVITKIQPEQVWSSNTRADRVEEITIYNAEGKEVTYKFTKDFRNGYNYFVQTNHPYSGITLVWDANTGTSQWNAAIANGAANREPIQRLEKGDIVQLALDKNDNVKRLVNYASYASTQADKYDVRVTSSNSRIILKGGTYSLNKDAVVFNVTSESDGKYDDVSIQSVSSVLAKDFTAAKAVAFDVKTGANVTALYIKGDLSVFQFGILTGNGRDSTGDYYTINGQKVYAAVSTIPTRYTVVSYQMAGGEATLTPLAGALNGHILANKTGYVSNLKALVAALNNSNINAVAGLAESYRSGNKALQVGDSTYVYITDSTYIYDLIDEKVLDPADLVTTPKKTVVAFYDKDGNADFIAVVGSGALTGDFVSETNASITWASMNVGAYKSVTSSNVNVATVEHDAGSIKITSKGAGTAVITVEGTDDTATINVTVAADGSITAVPHPIVVIGTDATISAITVKGVSAEDTTAAPNWTVELPYGTNLLLLQSSQIVVETANNATYTIVDMSVGAGTTWKITVTSEDGNTVDAYLLYVSAPATFTISNAAPAVTALFSGNETLNLASLVTENTATNFAIALTATITDTTNITYAGTTLTVADGFSGADETLTFKVSADGYADATITVTVKAYVPLTFTVSNATPALMAEASGNATLDLASLVTETSAPNFAIALTGTIVDTTNITYAGTTLTVADGFSGTSETLTFKVSADGYADYTITVTVSENQ